MMSILRWIAIFLCACVLANIALLWFDELPGSLDARNDRKYPLSADCLELNPGTDVPATLTILNRHGEPYSQRLDEKKLITTRGNIVCTVELDASNRVVKAESQSYAGLDLRGF
jgi:hypothetical protein